MALRYTVSGSILLVDRVFFESPHPLRPRTSAYTALFGVIIIGIGTGSLVFAEQWVPSGLAAVFITLSPFWMIGIDALIPGGERLHGPTIVGDVGGTSRNRDPGRARNCCAKVSAGRSCADSCC